MGGRRLPRRACFRARRQAHWQDSSSGNVRKPLLWRRQKKPTVHGRKPVSLRRVRRDPGRPDALTKCWHPPGGPSSFGFLGRATPARGTVEEISRVSLNPAAIDDLALIGNRRAVV